MSKKWAPTYLANIEPRDRAHLHLLLLRGIRRHPVVLEPLLHHVGRLLGQVAAPLAVEGVLVHAVVWLESYVVRVAVVVDGLRRASVRGLAVVLFLGAIVRIIGWRILIVAVSVVVCRRVWYRRRVVGARARHGWVEGCVSVS
jgi:hypothetical protein